MAVDFIIETIQFKRGTAQEFTDANPILLSGEPAFEVDTYKLKIGDGTTAWTSLPYASGTGGGTGLLGDLTDVGTAVPTDRHALIGNGTNFNTRALVSADISDIATLYGSKATQDSLSVQVATNTANIATNSANIAINTAKVSAGGSIDTHSDVDISGIGDGNVIKWNAAQGKFLPSSDTAASSLVNLTDVPSAVNIDQYVLVANGITGYEGRYLVKADITDLSAVEVDTTNTISTITTLSGSGGTGFIIDPGSSTVSLTGGGGTQLNIDAVAPYVASVSIADIDAKGAQALITKEYADANYGSIQIKDEGVSVITQATAINWIGTGVTVTDAGGGQANVTIAAGGDALTANGLGQFAASTSLDLANVISDETGTGALVFANSPLLVTPNLGTPSALTLTNATGLPLSTGVTGNLSVNNLNGGTGATASTFWCGDGTWKTPEGAGGGTGSYNFTYTEIPTGNINGVNTTFTVSQGKYRAGSLIAYVDGQAYIATLGLTEDYPESGIFTLEEPPNPGQAVYVTYQIGTPLPGNIMQSDPTGFSLPALTNMIQVTTAEYNGITPDPNTFYIITDSVDPTIPVSNTSANTIDLSRTGGTYMHMNSPSGTTVWNVTNLTLGGWAQVLINAASEPTITGATKIKGATFIAATNMYMIVFFNGNRVEYYFTEI